MHPPHFRPLQSATCPIIELKANMSIRDLSTERLCLRPIEVDEVEELHSLWTDEQVRRFLWDGEVISLRRTREIVEKSKALFDERGFGIWGIRERGSNELIGFAGYWHFRTPPSLELLFGVAPSHWHRGIATERIERHNDPNGQISKGFRLGGINDRLNVPLCRPKDLETFGGRETWATRRPGATRSAPSPGF